MIREEGRRDRETEVSLGLASSPGPGWGRRGSRGFSGRSSVRWGRAAAGEEPAGGSGTPARRVPAAKGSPSEAPGGTGLVRKRRRGAEGNPTGSEKRQRDRRGFGAGCKRGKRGDFPRPVAPARAAEEPGTR